MKKSLQIISLCLVLITLVTVLSSCNERKKLIGKWDLCDSSGTPIPNGTSYFFANDGTGYVNSEGTSLSITWRVEQNKLLVTISSCGINQVLEYTYEFSKNPLNLFLGDVLFLTDANGTKEAFRKNRKG